MPLEMDTSESRSQMLQEFDIWCRRRYVRSIVWKMKKYSIESMRKGMSYVQLNEEGLTGYGHISRRNCVLKHVVEANI
jgi:hypothetical protein